MQAHSKFIRVEVGVRAIVSKRCRHRAIVSKKCRSWVIVSKRGVAEMWTVMKGVVPLVIKERVL